MWGVCHNNCGIECLDEVREDCFRMMMRAGAGGVLGPELGQEIMGRPSAAHKDVLWSDSRELEAIFRINLQNNLNLGRSSTSLATHCRASGSFIETLPPCTF